MRHRLFVERRGWETLRRADGLDIDDRDDEATHLLATDSDGLFGYVRLLPGGYLVAARADPLLLQRAVGHRSVYGLSRFCIEKGDRGRPQCDAAFVALMRAVFQCACSSKFDVLMFDTDPSLIFVLRVAGFKIETIGRPVRFFGRQMVPVVLYVDESAFGGMASKWATWHDTPILSDGVRRQLW